MATTTPNFGWPVPTSTDLVKDGATAMEALGDAIDTSMVDLKGGTTGQVLAKASNTDMDFSWVAQDDSNAIQNSIVNAKGDLIGASANDTPAILSVGANGETLVADSSTSTGLRYQAPVNVNPILNSAFQIWQRGTSFTYGGGGIAYQADRWQGWGTGGGTAYTVTRQATGDTTNLPNIQYCLRMQRPSGNTNTEFWVVLQSMESVNSIPYAGKTVTLSFYARKGANFSGTSSAIQALLYSGTGTDQNLSSGFTGSAIPINSTATLTTTWQRFSYTGTISSTATQLGLNFNFQGSGTAGAADFFEITGVQLEVGSVATPFKTYAGTIQGELAACQRYYFRLGVPTSNAYENYGLGTARSTTAGDAIVQFPVTMRDFPASIDYANIAYYAGNIGASSLALSPSNSLVLASANRSKTSAIVYGTVASGFTANQAIYLTSANSTSSYLGFSAEL